MKINQIAHYVNDNNLDTRWTCTLRIYDQRKKTWIFCKKCLLFFNKILKNINVIFNVIFMQKKHFVFIIIILIKLSKQKRFFILFHMIIDVYTFITGENNLSQSHRFLVWLFFLVVRFSMKRLIIRCCHVLFV